MTFEPGGRREDPSQRIRRKDRKKLSRSGTVADDVDPDWAHRVATEVGFLFQNPISSWTPILEIGPQAGEVLDEHTDLTDTEIAQRVMDALGEVHLPKSKQLFGAFSSQLSRGMGQRAMLAAALVKSPRLLVADEPLSGLDVSVAAAILDLIKDLKERRNMSMIIVTHDLAVVSHIADRVAVVYAGRVIEEGAVGDVFRHPRHPYTSGLLGSMPAMTAGRLRPIPGEQPLLAAVPSGRCVFADRCEYVDDACVSSEPLLQEADGGSVACIRSNDLGLAGIG
jgi:peptide/nickel transport system ATP-binding protein